MEQFINDVTNLNTEINNFEQLVLEYETKFGVSNEFRAYLLILKSELQRLIDIKNSLFEYRI